MVWHAMEWFCVCNLRMQNGWAMTNHFTMVTESTVAPCKIKYIALCILHYLTASKETVAEILLYCYVKGVTFRDKLPQVNQSL